MTIQTQLLTYRHGKVLMCTNIELFTCSKSKVIAGRKLHIFTAHKGNSIRRTAKDHLPMQLFNFLLQEFLLTTDISSQGLSLKCAGGKGFHLQ